MLLISKQEAQIIAHEHIEGVILSEDVVEINSLHTRFPKSWIFDIYHRNQDKDTFHTIIEISRNGMVFSWNKYQVSDKDDIEE